MFFWGVVIGLNGSESNYSQEYNDELWKGRGFLVGLLVDFAYTTFLMQSHTQATFGMQAMRLKIIKVDGNKVELGALLLRYFVSIFSSIFLKLGYLYATISNKNQTAHDYLAGTIVIEREEETNEKNEIINSQNDNSKSIKINNTKTQNTTNYTSTKPIKNDEYLWEIAIEEYDTPARKKGLYAKIYAKQNGDESKIKSEYIKERYEQLKAEELEKIEKNRILKQGYNKNLSAEECINTNSYTSKFYKDTEYLLFANGQTAIKINEKKYRIYDNDDSLNKSLKYHASTGMYLTTGLLGVIEPNDEKIVISCPRCKQKSKVPKNKELEISCPSCDFNWTEKT